MSRFIKRLEDPKQGRTKFARVSWQPITTAANQLWLRQCAQKNYELPERTPEDLARLGQEID